MTGRTRRSMALGVVAAAALSGACAQPGAGALGSRSRTAAAPVPVPAGCDPARHRIDWSPAARTWAWTRVDRHLNRPRAAGDGTRVRMLAQTFRPSIAGVAAPESWLPALAASLTAATGDTVRGTPRPPGRTGSGAGAIESPEVAEIIRYGTVQIVSAHFVVRCRPAVRGTFTGWTSTTTGAVTCYDDRSPADAAGRRALRFCYNSPPLPGDPED